MFASLVSLLFPVVANNMSPMYLTVMIATDSRQLC